MKRLVVGALAALLLAGCGTVFQGEDSGTGLTDTESTLSELLWRECVLRSDYTDGELHKCDAMYGDGWYMN